MMVAKYDANGNDFVIFHASAKVDRAELARTLCDRETGIGADGLIVIVPHDTYDFEWQFYNADGSEAEMCGNGSRAAAHYAYNHALAPQKMAFLTVAGVIHAEVNDTMVLSELTPPVILDQAIEADGKRWWLINTGVPHLVTFDADMAHFDIAAARALRHRFNANVNIAQVQSDGSLKVRTYERGVEDETLACGTGMAACFVRANAEQMVEDRATVYPKSGDTLYLGKTAYTITFKGEVTPEFEVERPEITL
jgi:diaminopimelate epimerase